MGILRRHDGAAVWAAMRNRATCRNAQSHLRGPKRAAFAVAHAILVIAGHVLLRRVSYKELGSDFLGRQNKEAVARRLPIRLAALGDVRMLNSRSSGPAAGAPLSHWEVAGTFCRRHWPGVPPSPPQGGQR